MQPQPSPPPSDRAQPAQLPFVSSGFFVLRTPLLRFDELLAWGDGLEAVAVLDDPTRLAEAVARDRALLRARLDAVFSRPVVREALFVAAPAVEALLDLWAREPDHPRVAQVELTLARYFLRMGGRATPFGLFAGCRLGAMADETCLATGDTVRWKRHTRLDMDYVLSLTEALGRDPLLREALVHRPNSSLHRLGGRVRFVQSRPRGGRRSHHLVAAADSSALTATLARAAHGARPGQLAAALVEDGSSRSQADAYVADLIESQVLVPDLEPPITGPDPVETLVEQWREDPATKGVAAALGLVQGELAALDASGLVGVPPERYRAIARHLEPLPAKVDLSRLLQVDLVDATTEATLGQAPLAEIGRGVMALHRLFGFERQSELARFTEAFVARYEQEEIPLVEALDEELGIGFPARENALYADAPVLEGLGLQARTERTHRSGAREALLLQKLCRALTLGHHEIVLDSRDVEAMSAEDALPLPDAFAVKAAVDAPSPGALAAGDFRVFVEGVLGPSGARVFGRFCHVDERLRQAVTRHLRAEESLRPEAVFAEIVHLPEGRAGNILLRPIWRDYEIPYLGRSGAPDERQIPVTDLLLSVRSGRLVLRSARLAREVIPRLTSPHDFSGRGFGVYRFLCTLQGQGTAHRIGWDWGALAGAPFLPRVVLGRLVLALARWRVGRDETEALVGAQGSVRFRAAQRWRTERRLPRWVALADADNVLPIDLDNPLCVEVLVHLLKARDQATVVELFQTQRGYVQELIVPFVRRPSEGATATSVGFHARTPAPRLPRSKRRFPPGSDWLYAKLYTGTATADLVLRQMVRPLVSDLLASGAMDRWFFIRYADPDWHLRVRFHGPAARLHGEAQLALVAAAAPFLASGQIRRLQLDTYEPEVERYGGADGIELAERLFQVDSEAALAIVEALEPGDAGLDERWRLALLGVDRLLDDLGFDLEDKRRGLIGLRDGLAKELERYPRIELGRRFRRERQGLGRLLERPPHDDSPLWPGIEIYERRSKAWAPTIELLKARAMSGRLSVSLGDFAASLIHMHANRLLRSAMRGQEMLIYDCLARLYESRIACADNALASRSVKAFVHGNHR